MSKNYSVGLLSAPEVPQGIDSTEFTNGVWGVRLNTKIVAVCFEKEMADAIASNDLAMETVAIDPVPWFTLKMDGEQIGYCLGSVLHKADKFFGNK